MHCAIHEFLGDSNDITISLHDHRYGGEVIAMIVPVDQVARAYNAIEDMNGESEWELYGLRYDSWYPIASGDGITDALNRLRDWLKKNRKHWDLIRFGLNEVFNHTLHGRIKCNIVSFDDLLAARNEWNNGGDTINFFGTDSVITRQ